MGRGRPGVPCVLPRWSPARGPQSGASRSALGCSAVGGGRELSLQAPCVASPRGPSYPSPSPDLGDAHACGSPWKGLCSTQAVRRVDAPAGRDAGRGAGGAWSPASPRPHQPPESTSFSPRGSERAFLPSTLKACEAQRGGASCLRHPAQGCPGAQVRPATSARQKLEPSRTHLVKTLGGVVLSPPHPRARQPPRVHPGARRGIVRMGSSRIPLGTAWSRLQQERIIKHKVPMATTGLLSSKTGSLTGAAYADFWLLIPPSHTSVGNHAGSVEGSSNPRG